ncbi:glycosyltransferase family 2 protein [Mycoplasmoides pirum]|uniref:glycosyltransferase family 2 protein n=1 Tax=Mycoplasmoides pirum TaxID=2122 RepID=UPI0006967EA9|nr:glycosyltransferase family 2 protein [Mycoplasmoides pirum]
MKKINAPYILIFVLWGGFTSLSSWYLIVFQWENTFFTLQDIVVKFFLILNWLIINIGFCNGIKDFVILLTYYIYLKPKYKKNYFKQFNHSKLISKLEPKVLLLYTTCNDFDEQSLLQSINQNYSNFCTYILDDSDQEFYKNKIDNFINKNKNINLVRRKDKKGFKAGNINNFLMNTKEEFDYFVLLDSDEIIPNNFIKNCLPYFENNVGIVQANHKATRFSNLFDKLGSKGVLPAWTTFISFKNVYGSVTLNGHGAMIDRKCYYDSMGFPEIVAEDLGFAVNAINKKYKIVFAYDVICEEKFPVDFISFKKRNIKWTQGNFEFIKKFGLKLIINKTNFFKKLDLFLSSTSIFLTVFCFFTIIINFSILYPLGFYYKYSYFLWIFIVFFFLIPLLNDIIFLIRKENFFHLLGYLFFCCLLYPSMIISSILTFTFSIFGKKAKFIVTPKNSKKYTFWEAIKFNKLELISSIVLITLITLLTIFVNNFQYVLILWLVFFIIPFLSTPFLTLLSNKSVVVKN